MLRLTVRSWSEFGLRDWHLLVVLLLLFVCVFMAVLTWFRGTRCSLLLSKMDFYCLALSLLLVLLLIWEVNTASVARRQYSRNELLQLNLVRPAGVSDITLQLPDLILRDCNKTYGGTRETSRRRRKRGKRGKRGGVRLRLSKLRLKQTPLPSMILGNVQSLRNKMDELQENVCLFSKGF